MDKRSCENLLQAILEDKKFEDTKRSIQQSTRQEQRNKLKQRHNEKI